MYIWVVLATFLAILATFNLPVRHDMHQLESQPLAEAELNKMVVKHKASVKYARTKIKRVHGVNIISYEPGEVAEEKGGGFTPAGFVWDGDYASWIYCIAPDEQRMDNCNQMIGEKDYVVTIGELPDKWINRISGIPVGEYMRVLAKAMQKTPECGLVAEDDACNSGYRVKIFDDEEDGLCIPAGIADDALFNGVDLKRAVIYIETVYNKLK